MSYDDIMKVYVEAYRYVVGAGQDDNVGHDFGFYVSEQYKDHTYDEYLESANFAREWVRFSREKVGA